MGYLGVPGPASTPLGRRGQATSSIDPKLDLDLDISDLGFDQISSYKRGGWLRPPRPPGGPLGRMGRGIWGEMRMRKGLHGHTGARVACMATQERPAWPHRGKNGLHGNTVFSPQIVSITMVHVLVRALRSNLLNWYLNRERSQAVKTCMATQAQGL